MYLVAVMDWYSRRVLSWRVSSSLDAGFCLEALQEALHRSGAQFTSGAFPGMLKGHGIRISMDGKGRALDNVFVERLWRTVKYGHVCLNPADNGMAPRGGLKACFAWYNAQRPHSALGDKTPDAFHAAGIQRQAA